MRYLHLSLLSAVFLAGCVSSTTITVVDAGSKPISGATVGYYPLPHHKSDPYAATPAESRTTGADGSVTFAHNSGRFVATAPDKSSASFSSTFSPQHLELGVGAK